ncbi:hypothetical protein [Shewanella maritima]|uniref:hypothetical protein n=1 Tax=Shewanella maritima TaxID=2520507 RepID=UPI0037370527
MAIWKSLYDVFDKERTRVERTKGTTQAIRYEVEANVRFIAQASQSDMDIASIIQGLETQVFNQILKQGGSLSKTLLTEDQVVGYPEFQFYVGKTANELVHLGYQRIQLMKKLPVEQASMLKIKSLMRFLLLCAFLIDGLALPKRKV